jgi:trimeric autotransporter adhesin
MFSHSTNTTSFFSVLIAALIYSLSLAGVAAVQSNTSLGTGALVNNTTGVNNTAMGVNTLFFNTRGSQNTAYGPRALYSNTDGLYNTAIGFDALAGNTRGDYNTAIGAFALTKSTSDYNTASGAFALFSNTGGIYNTASGFDALHSNTNGNYNTASGLNSLYSNTGGIGNAASGFLADVSTGTLTNATAIGAQATVNASNKIRLGSTAVTVIEGQVAFTFPSDKTQKENFQPVNGEEVLGKIRGFELSSWNFIGHDPKEFRHYGPMAQDFFAAFGHDGVGQIGSETTINSGDMAGILMVAVQALEKRTAELKQKEAQIAALAARLEALELRKNQPIQITADDRWVFVAK